LEIELCELPVIIDPEDYEWVSKLEWHYNHSEAEKKGLYYMRTWLKDGTIRYKAFMHRLVLKVPYGSKIHVDHINGNTLDNRRCNLRVTDNRHNQQNRKVGQSNSVSGYKGVGWHTASGKWRVRIQVGNARIYAGLYTDSIEAAKVYDELAKQHFGEFARLNFPEAIDKQGESGILFGQDLSEILEE
jgi:hypothetical protein